MDKTEKAFKELAKRRREIDAIRADIVKLQDDLKIKETYVLGMEEALRHFEKPEVSSKPKPLRPGTDLDRAYNFLLLFEEPAHINDIMAGLGKEITKTARVSLAGSLTRYASKNHIFCKTAPNTFGLIEQQDANVVPFERDEYA